MLLAIPNLGVDRIYLGVEDLHAHVDLHAKVLDLLELHVGADVGIRKVELEIDNVRVQAMLKVKLDKVVEIVGSVVELLDHHPEILSNLTGGLGRGLEGALAGGRPVQHELEGQARAQRMGDGSMPEMPKMPQAGEGKSTQERAAETEEAMRAQREQDQEPEPELEEQEPESPEEED